MVNMIKLMDIKFVKSIYSLTTFSMTPRETLAVLVVGI